VSTGSDDHRGSVEDEGGVTSNNEASGWNGCLGDSGEWAS